MLNSKFLKENRSLLFLIITIIIGIVLIGLLRITEDINVPSSDLNLEQPKTSYKELENKIELIKSQKFDPTSYNTIATEIESSYEQKLITNIVKNNLLIKLENVYSNLIFNKCELYLNSNNLNTSTDLLNWLQELKNITSNNKLVYYNSQIKAYDYYSIQFIKKVNVFCDSGNFDENEYGQLKNEANSMPKLNSKYKNNNKFIRIKNQCVNKLELAYRVWNEQDSDF
jgi:hypothetical protein